MNEIWDCIIIGGGIAGLQAAIQIGRGRHRCLVIDSNINGRSTLCKQYRNILGYPDGVSGFTLRTQGKLHAQKTGVQFVEGHVRQVDKALTGFKIQTEKEQFHTKTILFATGITDRLPPIPQLYECLGSTIYICSDCDGYEIIDKKTIVLGSGEVGAKLALSLKYWTDKLTYINHELAPIGDGVMAKLNQENIHYIAEEVQSIDTHSPSQMTGVYLKGGRFIAGERAFVGFGGNMVHTELAKQLGVEITENQHIQVDPRTKETNISDVWAAGDIVAHSEQVTIAMGDATQAAIWIHKRLTGVTEE